LVAAQEAATIGDSQTVVYCVLATKLYDEMLSWTDTKHGGLAQEVGRIREDLKAEREAQKQQRGDGDE
jgi:hypothetical protein